MAEPNAPVQNVPERPSTDPRFPNDVAFSFLQQDEALALRLADYWPGA